MRVRPGADVGVGLAPGLRSEAEPVGQRRRGAVRALRGARWGSGSGTCRLVRRRRPGGGGGGMVLSSGAMSGQMSSTRQGAWSMTKRVAGPRLRGPRRSRSPSRARMRMSIPQRRRRPRVRLARVGTWRVAGRPSRACASVSSSWAACSEIVRSSVGLGVGVGVGPAGHGALRGRRFRVRCWRRAAA